MAAARVKERLFSSFDFELGRLATWAAPSLLALFSVGCPEPADLEEPNSYCRPGASIVDANGKVTGCNDSGSSGGTPAGGGGSPAAASCDSACITALFTGSCNVCHSASNPQAGLDLASANFTARLKDQPATHSGATGCPTGDKLVDSANPSASWLLKKVAKQQGSCGTPMPQPLGGSDADIACVTAYVNCIGGNP